MDLLKIIDSSLVLHMLRALASAGRSMRPTAIIFGSQDTVKELGPGKSGATETSEKAHGPGREFSENGD